MLLTTIRFDKKYEYVKPLLTDAMNIFGTIYYTDIMNIKPQPGDSLKQWKNETRYESLKSFFRQANII